MKIEAQVPAREFHVGYHEIVISHVANVALEDDQMVTFVGSGTEYDVTRKSWGYYATPSLDRRLPAHGLRPAIMRNTNTRHCFVVLVEVGQEEVWRDYMDQESQELVMWLDDPAVLESLGPRDGR